MLTEEKPLIELGNIANGKDTAYQLHEGHLGLAEGGGY